MSDAHFELDEISRNLKYNVVIAQLDYDTKLTLWKQKEASIIEKRHLLVEDMEVEIKHLTKMIHETEEECRRAVKARQRMVTIIEEEAKKKQAEARHAYEGAVTYMESDLRAAHHFVQHAQEQRNHQYQLVCKEEGVHAKIEATDLELISFVDAFNHHEHSSGYEIFRKVCVPIIEHESSEDSVEVDLICTKEVVRKGHIHFPAYWNALKNLKFAEHTYSRVQRTHEHNVAAKKMVLDTLIESFAAAVKKAKHEVETTRVIKQEMVEIAKRSLHDFKVHRTSELTLLEVEIEKLQQSAEYLAYVHAEERLTVAKTEHELLLIRKMKLELLFKAQREKVVVSSWAIESGITAINVDRVTLHGHLKKLVDRSGDFIAPLDAKVEIHIHKRPFHLNLKCDPRKFDDFVHKVFHG
jgi:hypothetical protein